MKKDIIVLFVLLLLGCTAERQVLPELAAEKMIIPEISGYDEQKQIIQDRFLLKTNHTIEFTTFEIHHPAHFHDDYYSSPIDEIVFISKIPVNQLVNSGHIVSKEHLSEFFDNLNKQIPSDLQIVTFFPLLSIELKETKLQQKVLTFEEFETLSNDQKIDGAIYLCGRTFRSSGVEF
jgi:hypothetical protein